MGRNDPRNWIRRSVLVAFHLLAIVGLTNCSAGTIQSEAGMRGSHSIILDVTNAASYDVVLYALRDDTRLRLRRIGAKTRVRIEIPRAVTGAGRIQIMVKPFASSEEYKLPELRTLGDERVEVTIEGYLPLSSLVVR